MVAFTPIVCGTKRK